MEASPQAAATLSASEPVTVYYDGACPLCVAEMAHYRRQDREGRLRLIDVSQGDAALPSGLSRQAALARLHVVDSEGRLRSGAAAFAALWRAVPAWVWLGRIAQTRLAGSLLEGLYRLFLPVRPVVSGLARRLVRARDR